MNEALGVIDAIQARISEAKKFPLSDKVMIDQRDVLKLIEKLRHILTHKNAARDAIVRNNIDEVETKVIQELPESKDLVESARKESLVIQREASEYADNVLARLQLLVTKMQKNLIRLEKNVDEGRLTLDQSLRGQTEERNEL